MLPVVMSRRSAITDGSGGWAGPSMMARISRALGESW